MVVLGLFWALVFLIFLCTLLVLCTEVDKLFAKINVVLVRVLIKFLHLLQFPFFSLLLLLAAALLLLCLVLIILLLALLSKLSTGLVALFTL